MKIMTDGPVDLCYSRADGKALSPDTITAIGQTVGQVGSSLAQRQRQFTEVEQKCGKRPIVPGKRRNAWDACALEYAKSSGVPASAVIPAEVPSAAAQPSKKVPTWVWVVGGVAVAGVLGLIVYKSMKK